MAVDPNPPFFAVFVAVCSIAAFAIHGVVDKAFNHAINEYNLVKQQYYQGKQIELPTGFGLSYNRTSDGCHAFSGQGGLFAFKLCGVQTRVDDRCVFFFDARTNTTKTICQYPSALIAGPKGATGPQGVDGPQGIQGLNGTQGYNGTQGIQGLQGDTGERGYNGTKGLPGEKGDRGINGTQGDVGDQGPIGDVGDQGAQGIQGEQGDQGLPGLPGNSTFGNNGTKGDTGPQGPDGPQGIQGVTGADGPEGLRGINGTKGLKGATGAKGATGDVGDKGATGSAGATGATGADGPQGAQGPQGADGPAGNTGLAGPRGNDAQPSLVDRVIMDSLESKTGVETTGGSTTVHAAIYHDNGFYGDGSSGNLVLFGTFDSVRYREAQFNNLKLVGAARIATQSAILFVNDTLDLSESTVDGSIMPMLWNENNPTGGTTSSGVNVGTGGLRTDANILVNTAYDLTTTTTQGTPSVATTTSPPSASSTCGGGMVGSFGQNPTCSGPQGVAGRSVGLTPQPATLNGVRTFTQLRVPMQMALETNTNPPQVYSGSGFAGFAGQSGAFTPATSAGSGGPGGAGAFLLVIKARRIILPNSPVVPFMAPGGQGTHGSRATATTAGAGGGGSGGSGGPVILYYNELVGTMLAPLIRVDGGYGGDGGCGFDSAGTHATGGGGGSGGECGRYTVYDTGSGQVFNGPTTAFGMPAGPSISGQDYGSSGVRGCRMHWPFSYQTTVSEINLRETYLASPTLGTVGRCAKLSRDGQFLYTIFTRLNEPNTGAQIVVLQQTSPGVWVRVFQYTPTIASVVGDLGGFGTCDLTPDGTRFVAYNKMNTGTSYSFISITKTGASTWVGDETTPVLNPANAISASTVYISINGAGDQVILRSRATADQYRLCTLSGTWSQISAPALSGVCSVSGLGTGEGPVFIAKNSSYILAGILNNGQVGFCHLSSALATVAFYGIRNATAPEAGSRWVTGITASDDGNVVYVVTTDSLGRSMISTWVTRTSGGPWVELGTGVYLASSNTAGAVNTFTQVSISCTPDGRVVVLGSRSASTPMGQAYVFRKIGDRLWPFANPLSSKKGVHTSAWFGCDVSITADGLQVAVSSCPAFSTATRTQPRIFVHRFQDGFSGTPPRAALTGPPLVSRATGGWASRVAMSANGWAIASGSAVLFRRRHGVTTHQFVFDATAGEAAFTDHPVTLLDHGGTASIEIGQLGSPGSLTLGADFTSCISTACTTTFNTITTLSSTSEPYSACATRNMDFVYVSKGTTLYLLMGRTAALTQVGMVTLASNNNARHRAYMGCSTAGEIVAVLRPSPLAVWVYTLSQFADPVAMGTTPVTLSPIDNHDAVVGTHLSVSADGSTIVAAAASQLWVFRRTGGTWAQVGSRLVVDTIEVASVHLTGKYLWTLSATELNLYHWKDGAFKIYQDRVGVFPTGNALSLASSHNGSVCVVTYYNSSLTETRAQVFSISQLPMMRSEHGDPIKRLPKEVTLSQARNAPPRALFGATAKLSRDGNWLAISWPTFSTNVGILGIFHRESATRSYLVTNENVGAASNNRAHSMCFVQTELGDAELYERSFTGTLTRWTFDAAQRRMAPLGTVTATVSTTGATAAGETNKMMACGSADGGVTRFIMSGRVATGLNSVSAFTRDSGNFAAFPTADIPIPGDVVASTSSWGSALAMSDDARVLAVYARRVSTGQGDDAYYVYRRALGTDGWGTVVQILQPYAYPQPGTLNPPAINGDGSVIAFVSKTGGVTSHTVSVYVFTWVPAASKYVLTSVPAPFAESLKSANVDVVSPAQPQQVEISANAERLFFSFPQLTGATTGGNLFYMRRASGQSDYYTIDGTQHVGPTMTASSPARHSMAMSADGDTMVSTESVTASTDMRVNLLEVDRL